MVKKAFTGTDYDNDVTFTLNLTGPVNRTITIKGSDDWVVVDNLPEGEYTLSESSPIGLGYELVSITQDGEPDDTIDVHIESNAQVLVTNRRLYGSAEFSKIVDNIDDDATEFALTVTGDNGYHATVTVGEMLSPVVLTDLPFGTYTVTETDAPGYSQFGIENGTFTIDATNYNNEIPVQVVATNHKKLGQIKALKKDSGDPTLYLGGAEFKISTSETDFDANVVDTIVTDATTGAATSKQLPLGTYWIKETKAPAGYVIDNAQPVKVEVAQQDTAYTVTFTDTRNEGALRIQKVSTLDGKPVKGVKFQVARDEAFTDLLQADPYVTDENGEVVIDHLPAGSVYWVRESDPAPGYDINRAIKYKVTIPFGGTVTVQFANTPQGTVKVLKVDGANAAALSGAVYGVYGDAECTTLVSQLSATGTDGTAMSGELPFGAKTVYYVKEITPPSGYLLSTEVQSVTFTAPGQVVSLTFKNTKNIGSLIIRKVDALDATKMLAGAEFALYSDAGLTTQVGFAVTTGTDGIARFDNLVPGTYYLKETKAPEDYDILAAALPVTVTAGVTEPDPLVITNQYNPPEDIATGMMDYNILAIGGIALLGGILLVVFSRRKRRAKVK